jgi:N-acetylmuramoyl-L-alanine amidase
MMALLEGRKDAVEPPRSEQDFQISERRPDDLASVKPEKAPIEAPEVLPARNQASRLSIAW